MSLAKARTLLGPAAPLLTCPASLDKLERDNHVEHPPDTGLEDGAPIPRRYVRAAERSTGTTTTTPPSGAR